MQYKANSPEEYIAAIPEERREPIRKLRDIINKNLPDGFQETMNYGMIGWVVPHELYAPGYHVDPKQPLPFMSIASQKNFIGLYHMGIYGDNTLYNWFTEEYTKQVPTKLDMGKSCVRLKKAEHIPYDLIGDLCKKMTPEKWIGIYESHIKR